MFLYILTHFRVHGIYVAHCYVHAYLFTVHGNIQYNYVITSYFILDTSIVVHF